MKKRIINVLCMSALMLMSVNFSQAQVAPKFEVGGMVGNMNGFTFKTFFTPKFSFQLDLVCTYSPTYSKVEWSRTLFHDSLYVSEEPFNMVGNWNNGISTTFELNPVFLYQSRIATFEAGRLDWFVGGGARMSTFIARRGFFRDLNVGANVVAGTEFLFAKVPLSFQFDLRPGFTFLVTPLQGINYAVSLDWSFNFSVRYCFGQFKGK